MYDMYVTYNTQHNMCNVYKNILFVFYGEHFLRLQVGFMMQNKLKKLMDK